MLINLVIMLVLLALACLTTRAKGEALYSEELVVPLPPTHPHRGITGTILELKDGSLLFAYTVDDHAPPESFGINARKSQDRGRTWSKPYLLQRLGMGWMAHPSLLRLKDGKILFAYSVGKSGEDLLSGHDDAQQYVRISGDEGQTWTEQICMTLIPGVCLAMPDRLRQLSTGRIILSIDLGLQQLQDVAAHGYLTQDKGYVSLCVYSDNGGYTWWFSKNYVQVPGSYETGEPVIAELADGRLILLARTRLGYLARSYSTDQGETWSPGELVHDLPASIPSPLMLVRVPTTGDLLCLWCRNTYAPGQAAGEEIPSVPMGTWTLSRGQVRAPLSSAISRDGGQTWENARDLTHDPPGVYGDYGYPCVTFLDGGKTALANYNSLDGIRLARIDVDWFYGK
jgi:sialidase-1